MKWAIVLLLLSGCATFTNTPGMDTLAEEAKDAILKVCEFHIQSDSCLYLVESYKRWATLVQAIAPDQGPAIEALKALGHELVDLAKHILKTIT